MEIDSTIYESVERIVLTDGNVITRIVLCAALAHNDVACQALLTAKNLNAQSLGSALATILRTTYTFFMSHMKVLLVLSDY